MVIGKLDFGFFRVLQRTIQGTIFILHKENNSLMLDCISALVIFLYINKHNYI